MFACGPWSRASHNDGTVRQHQRVASEDPVASSFDVRVHEGVQLSLTMTNNTRHMLELQFPSGLTHDFVVLDELDREVWRWSGGRMFTSVVRTKLMKSGNSVTYAAEWEPELPNGKYVAVATLHSSNFPVTTRVPFTLP